MSEMSKAIRASHTHYRHLSEQCLLSLPAAARLYSHAADAEWLFVFTLVQRAKSSSSTSTAADFVLLLMTDDGDAVPGLSPHFVLSRAFLFKSIFLALFVCLSA